jgi:hypothetical protein
VIETREFEYDPATGIRTWFHYDHDTDTFTLEKVQDVAPILEENLLIRNATEDRWKGDGHGVRVASLPIHLWAKLRKDRIIDDHDPKQTRFRAWLNERDNSMFRTKTGRV